MSKLIKFAGNVFGFMRTILPASLLLFFISCMETKHIDLNGMILQDPEGREVNVKAAAGDGIVVFLFMSTDCPLCINYTKTIRELHQQFVNRGVTFLPVYAGSFYTSTEIREFNKKYNFEIQGILDPDYVLTKKLKATVTPEAVVLSREGDKVYSGAIDNWMFETGKKSPVITEKYLEDALTQLLNGKLPDPEKTIAIGCYIEL